jgi:hypothetical protein
MAADKSRLRLYTIVFRPSVFRNLAGDCNHAVIMPFLQHRIPASNHLDKGLMIARRTVRKLGLGATAGDDGAASAASWTFVAVLAVALQIQATLPIGASGIRVALSDLLLPIIFIYVAHWLRTSPSGFRWRASGVGWWLLVISLVLSVALLVGHERLGRWSSWAILNKWGGWFALVAYFLAGAIIVRSGGIELRAAFLRTFFLVAAATALLNTVTMPWLLMQYTLPVGIEFNRATGGMQNANAFGFLLAVTALLISATERRPLHYLSPVLAGLWFTSSRGALLAYAVGLLAFLAFSPRTLVPIVKALAIAVLAVAAITAISLAVDPGRAADLKTGRTPLGFLSLERLDLDAATIRERQAQNQRAVALFADAPVFGQGLGYFVAMTGVTLHNSLLWLVIETGIAGAAVFAGFLAWAVWSFYLGREDSYLLGMIAVSLAFMAVSITGEFLYQRHLWLLLGMALASPPAARSAA